MLICVVTKLTIVATVTNYGSFVVCLESRLYLSNDLIAVQAVRVKRQEETSTKKEDSFEAELCKDKDAGEWFRLVAGEGDNCRDVIQCTSSVGF